MFLKNISGTDLNIEHWAGFKAFSVKNNEGVFPQTLKHYTLYPTYFVNEVDIFEDENLKLTLKDIDTIRAHPHFIEPLGHGSLKYQSNY